MSNENNLTAEQYPGIDKICPRCNALPGSLCTWQSDFPGKDRKAGMPRLSPHPQRQAKAK